MAERGPRALQPERNSHKSHSLKPPLLYSPFAGGGSTLLGEDFPDAWEPAKAAHPCHSQEETPPPRAGAMSLLPLPVAAAASG